MLSLRGFIAQGTGRAAVNGMGMGSIEVKEGAVISLNTFYRVKISFNNFPPNQFY